jgi:serine/threonine protein kinase
MRQLASMPGISRKRGDYGTLIYKSREGQGSREMKTVQRGGPLPVGSTLQGGQYVIQSVLGMGGFGVTYRAHDTRLERSVAIKELFPGGCERDGTAVQLVGDYTEETWHKGVRAFLIEAQFVARLHHPGIITIYEYFDENNTAYMAMRYIEGSTLAQKVKEHGPFTEAEAVRYARQIGDALREVHDQDILHRDIKPSNILLSTRGQVVLIDFGAAHRLVVGSAVSSTTIGTKGFAPPEQYYPNLPLGAYTDIYGFAATLHYILTGKAPQEGPILSDPKLNPKIRSALAHALALEAAQRPHDVDTFLAELEGYAPPPSPRGYISTPPTPMLTPNTPQPGVSMSKEEAEEYDDTSVLTPKDGSNRKTGFLPSLKQNTQPRSGPRAQPDAGDDWLEITEDLGAISGPTGARVHQPSLTEQDRQGLFSLLDAAIASDEDEVIIAAWHPVLDGYAPAEAHRPRFDRAQERLAAYRRFMAALASNDDARIVASYVTALQNYPRIAYSQLQRVDQARINLRLKHELEQALAKANVEEALRIQETARTPLHDAHLNVATAGFLSPLDPKNLEAQLQGDRLIARWVWPNIGSIRAVSVTWRADRWPQRPEEPGTHMYTVSRDAYARKGSYNAVVGNIARIYVRVFSAIQQTGPLGQPVWVYSQGGEPTSRRLARKPCTIECRLLYPVGSAQNSLEVWSSDGDPLPDLLVVRKARGMPLGARDGHVVARVQAGHVNRTVVQLDVVQWPRQTFVRVFAANDDDADYVIILSGHGSHKIAVS